ncbi:hypothetical protein ACTXT7_016825, partial [Hymenolepis weldensis]
GAQSHPDPRQVIMARTVAGSPQPYVSSTGDQDEYDSMGSDAMSGVLFVVNPHR